MKKIFYLFLVVVALFLVSCSDNTTPTETTPICATISTTEQTSMTNATTETATSTVATTATQGEPSLEKINIVLPYDLKDDVYWCAKMNEELLNNETSIPGTVLKDDFVFADDRTRIAVYVEAIDCDGKGGFFMPDYVEMRCYYESVGIEFYVWGNSPYIIVNKQQAESLGTIAGHESYIIKYVQAAITWLNSNISDAEKEKALEIYKKEDTCDFYIDVGPKLDLSYEIKCLERINGKAFTDEEKDEMIRRISDAYYSKFATYLHIDFGSTKYRFSKLSTDAITATLTKEEFEDFLSSNCFVSHVYVITEPQIEPD